MVSSCKVWMKLLEPLPQKNDVSFEAIIKENDQKSMNADLKRVYDFIEEKSFDGATCGELTEAFKYDTVLKQLQELIDLHYVFRVGIIQTRFVTKAHIKPWVLKSFDLKRTDREKAGKWTTKGKMTLEQAKSNEVGEYGNVFKVLYISIHFKPISGETIENVDWSQVNMIDIHIRPWVKLNGLINRKILDQLLTSILYHTLSHPGSTIAKITNYIQPALQPFHIRELLGKGFDGND